MGGDSDGIAGQGGNAISGSSNTIINAGNISAGSARNNNAPSILGKASAPNGVAIAFTEGTNSLTLQQGSVINGDIVLSDAVGIVKNSLAITSEAATSITGAECRFRYQYICHWR